MNRERLVTWTGVILMVSAAYLMAAQAPIANLGGNTSLRGTIPALSVEIVDADGEQITTLGGGFNGVAEDATFAGGDTVIPLGCVRDDGATTATSAAGTYSGCLTNASGEMVVAAVLRDTNGNAITLATETATTVVDLDNDESETEISDTSGCVSGIYVGNRDTTPVFVKVFLVDADDVIVGTTVPNMVFMVPSSSTDGVSGNVMPSNVCIPFTTGLSIATVTDEADAASTGPAANEVVLTVFIKS